MAVLRMSAALADEVRQHVLAPGPEHFAFLLARTTWSDHSPVFIAEERLLVPAEGASRGTGGYELSTEWLLEAVNRAVRGGWALVECHGHGGDWPRFSRTDRVGLTEIAPYVLDSLPGRPYLATVWGDERVYGEWFASTEHRGVLRSATIAGTRLAQLISRDDDFAPLEARFARQQPWFGAEGQQALGRLRVGVVGAGGTGSQVVEQLVYLGCRDFVVVDADRVDATNLNRLVSASFQDLGTSKVELATRLVKRVAPDATVIAVMDDVRSPDALDKLRGVDLLFSCVDNDGARLVLNEVALAYRIPLFDVAVGITTIAGELTEAGGRLVVVQPYSGGCLYCLGEIDPAEARFFLGSDHEKAFAIERGYVSGLLIPAPAVISLNGAVAALAMNEFALWCTGVRSPAPHHDLDLVGSGRSPKGQWLQPHRNTDGDPRCVQCATRGLGDSSGVMRYALPGR